MAREIYYKNPILELYNKIYYPEIDFTYYVLKSIDGSELENFIDTNYISFMINFPLSCKYNGQYYAFLNFEKGHFHYEKL